MPDYLHKTAPYQDDKGVDPAEDDEDLAAERRSESHRAGSEWCFRRACQLARLFCDTLVFISLYNNLSLHNGISLYSNTSFSNNISLYCNISTK